jgi:hypothetical protein
VYRRLIVILACVSAMAASSGCRWWPGARMPWAPPAPVVFTAPPTADDIVRAVNSNAAPIRQLSTDSATVTAAGFPPLRANLAFERPQRFRLRASLLGPELDVGSNEELFWMWVKHSPEPGVFYARHDQFANSPARQLFPLDPSLVVDSFGLLQLDPLAAYDAPRDLGDRKVEIRTRIPSPEGDLTRVIVVHDRHGWVLEQRLFDTAGRNIATALASDHRHYPEAGVSLPHRLEVRLPAAQLNFTINVRNFRVNQLDGNPAQLWTLPQMEGYPLVNIADPRNLPVSRLDPPASPNAGPGPSNTPLSAPRAAPLSAPPRPDVYRPNTNTSNVRSRYRGFW